MSKNGLLKSGWVIMNQTDARVIDTNALVESKLKELSEKLSAETQENADFTDGFMQGIDAMQVAELVEGTENQENPESNVIKGEPEQEGPTKEELLEQAMAEIEEMKKQAVAEIEQAKKKACEEGKKAGYQAGMEEGKKAGYDAGHKEGLQSVSRQREEALREADEKIEQMEAYYQQRISELEPQFIDTLTGIYEHIFQVSLKNSRELVVYLIANTMRNIEGSSGYLIHVSKEDYPFVSMQKKELIKGTGIVIDAVDIIEDATLGKSECMIETGNGVFDCSLGTQLEALNEELRLLSYSPKLQENEVKE